VVLCAELAVPGNVVGAVQSVVHFGALVGPGHGVSRHKGFTYVFGYSSVRRHKTS